MRKLLTSLWHKYLLGARAPWSVTTTDPTNGKMVITDFNQAFVADVREQMSDIQGLHTPAELVKMWVDRVNYERETPRLEMIHSSVSEDGRITMKLDWNAAFIKQLHDLGIVGETEEDTIQIYLDRMTRAVTDEEVATARKAAAEGRARPPDEREIADELEQMDPELIKTLEKVMKTRLQRKHRKRTLDL